MILEIALGIFLGFILIACAVKLYTKRLGVAVWLRETRDLAIVGLLLVAKGFFGLLALGGSWIGMIVLIYLFTLWSKGLL